MPGLVTRIKLPLVKDIGVLGHCEVWEIMSSGMLCCPIASIYTLSLLNGAVLLYSITQVHTGTKHVSNPATFHNKALHNYLIAVAF